MDQETPNAVAGFGTAVERWLVVAVSLALVPTALAAAVSGHVDVAGRVSLPASGVLTDAPEALFVQDASRLGSVSGSLPVATIDLHEETWVGANVAGQQPRVFLPGAAESSWSLHAVRMQLLAARPGWIGLRPAASGGGSLRERGSTGIDITSDANPRVGNGRTSTTDDASKPDFADAPGRAMLMRSVDAWDYSGGASVKVFGPTIVLDASENSTRIQTGDFADPSDPTRSIERWAIVTFEAGSLAATGAQAEVASDRLAATWDGAADLASSRGTLEQGTDVWTGDATAATLVGDLRAALSVDTTGTDITMDVTGDLRSTTMSHHALLPVANGAAAPWWAMVLVAGVVVAGGAAFAATRGRRRRVEVGADELSLLAERAADAEDFEKAASVAAEARRASPTSRRLALDHGYYVSRIEGRLDEALALLDAPLLAEDADASLLKADLLLRASRADEAAAALARALDVAPSALLDVESDPALAPLRARPDVRAAIARARRRLR